MPAGSTAPGTFQFDEAVGSGIHETSTNQLPDRKYAECQTQDVNLENVIP